MHFVKKNSANTERHKGNKNDLTYPEIIIATFLTYIPMYIKYLHLE